jgi:hypothetical protein
MSRLEAIQARLPVPTAAQLQDWLADYREDSAELSLEFKANIEKRSAELREGHVRVHRPGDE